MVIEERNVQGKKSPRLMRKAPAIDIKYAESWKMTRKAGLVAWSDFVFERGCVFIIKFDISRRRPVIAAVTRVPFAKEMRSPS